MYDTIAPTDFFTTILQEPCPKEIESCLEQAWSQLARDGKGIAKPHCATLDYVLPIEKMFEERPYGHYQLKVYVFETDIQMNYWTTAYGDNRIIDRFYNRKDDK